MQIQIDIPKELNKKLKISKAIFGEKNLEETIIRILNKDFKKNE